jgi:hypothetical protein
MIYPAGMTRRRRRAAGGYDVRASLFSNGEVGGWWDPSDPSTLFQDATGTTPVTTLGQPVGLVIDKSKGGLNALGAELVVNGDFASATGWTLVACSIASGKLTLAAAGANAQRSMIGGAGSYFVSVNKLVGAGNANDVALRFRLGSTNVLSINIGSTNLTQGTGLVYVPGAFDNVFINTGIAATTEIDLVSIREVPGTHLVQTTDTARPRWDARANLLVASEDITAAAWVKPNYTIASAGSVQGRTAYTATSTIAGQLGATGSNNVVQSVSGVLAAQYTFSALVKAGTVSGLQILITGTPIVAVGFDLAAAVVVLTSGCTASATSVGDGWVLVTMTYTKTATGVNVFWIGPTATPASGTASVAIGDSFQIAGAQLEFGPTATQYQRVTTATDYADIGLPRYFNFDGLDDFFRTPVGADINFTSTDEMTVCCGVRKLSDAAFAPVAELSANAGANDGSFIIYTPSAAGAGDVFYASRGTIARSASSSAGGFPAPSIGVLTGLSDISGDVVQLRLDGSLIGSSLLDQGTGNYGTYPLFIGRRAGTSNPFNGRLNQLIIRNRLTADGDLANLERFVAAKTGVTLP